MVSYVAFVLSLYVPHRSLFIAPREVCFVIVVFPAYLKCLFLYHRGCWGWGKGWSAGGLFQEFYRSMHKIIPFWLCHCITSVAVSHYLCVCGVTCVCFVIICSSSLLLLAPQEAYFVNVVFPVFICCCFFVKHTVLIIKWHPKSLFFSQEYSIME